MEKINQIRLKGGYLVLIVFILLFYSLYGCKIKSNLLYEHNREIFKILNTIIDTTKNDFLRETSSYLITHDSNLPENLNANDFLVNYLSVIENSKKKSWTGSIGPKEFCEYLLPPLYPSDWNSNWRKQIHQIALNVVDSVKSDHFDTLNNNELITNILNNKDIQFSRTGAEYYSSFRQLISSTSLDCNGLTSIGVYIYRSLHIPCAFDFTPQWGNYHDKHFWGTIVRLNKPNLTFNVHPDRIPPFNFDWSHDRKFSKVYRKTFSVNQNSHRMLYGYNHNLPSLFNNPLIKDVSGEYNEVSRAEVVMNDNRGDKKVIYLSVFDNQDWVLVGWSDSIQKQNVIFESVFDSVVYLPQKVYKEDFQPVDYPFFMYKGLKYTFIPEYDSLQSVVLSRKFSLEDRRKLILERSRGGRFEGSNDSSFTKVTELFRIDSTLEAHGYEFLVKKNEKVRYLRYIGTDSSYCNIAEISFFDKLGNKVLGKIIGNEPNSSINEAFDDNPLTYYQSSEPNDSWIGLGLEKPKQIHKIRMYPRSDLNGIEINDTYELFYWDEKWISLGRKIAAKNKLIYENVPKNSLLLLRNLSSGIEERIFSYHNNTQYFF